MTAISQMNAAEIRVRLDAIKGEQAKHAARNFDEELAAVMRKGGDIDELEAAHLEAERVSRRLRVEKSALEVELPEVVKREASVQVDNLAAEHSELVDDAVGAVDQLVTGWGDFLAGLARFQDVQNRAAVLTNEAASLARSTGTSMPPGLGYFNSSTVIGVLKTFYERQHELSLIMHTAEQAVDSGVGDFSSRFAKTMLATEANDNLSLAAGA